MIDAPWVDQIQPFQIESSNLRGRFVRLGLALDTMLTRRSYPEIVDTLLGETVALTALLGSALKFDGVFSLQTSGSGPVTTLFSDMTSDGAMRAFARFDPQNLPLSNDAGLGTLLGPGHLAFTVDQGSHTDRYQGLVDLVGEDLGAAVRHYFRQSEQIDAGFKIAVDRRETGWLAGGIMIQRLPDAQAQPVASDREDDWRRAMILLDTATDRELMDPDLPAANLLYRLYHEDGVRIFTPRPIRAECRCSRERLGAILSRMSRDEVMELAVDGVIEATCDFCGTVYGFSEQDVVALFTE